MDNRLLILLALNDSKPAKYEIALPFEDVYAMLEQDFQNPLKLIALRVEMDDLSETNLVLRGFRFRKEYWYRDLDFSRYFDASFKNTANGTLLEGKFMMPVYMIWTTVLVMFLLGIIYMFGFKPFTILNPYILLVFSPVFWVYIRRLAGRKGEQAVLLYLSKTFADHIISKKLPPEL